jgi:putative FmdB family regulatory protein
VRSAMSGAGSVYFAVRLFERKYMPFYEYQCKSCGHELEAMQKVSDAPLKKCPHCGKSQLQRLMSAPVFRLKGAGWYETDFKGDKDNQRNLADRPEADASKESKDKDATAKEKGKDEKGKDEKGKEGKDEKGKEGKDAKAVETKASEAPSTKEPASKEKSPDKPAEKSSGSGAAQKPTAANRSSRGGRLKKKSIKVKRRR